ncbi:hypothetical protein D3C87_75450 [compost metagenome]
MEYEEVLVISNQLNVHKSFTFCKKKYGRYLKLYSVDSKQLFKLFEAIEKRVGTRRTFSFNPANKTATVTLYSEEERNGKLSSTDNRQSS